MEIFNFIDKEKDRQHNQIELIASENIVSNDILRAQGSILTNKYAEGYPGRRYYGGCEHVDDIERFAIQKARELFNCKYVNVQPHSGSQANQAVYLALLNPGDTVLGMDLNCGGHLTHGCKVNLSGKWFNFISYGLNSDERINMRDVREKANQYKPKLIIAGGSAYSRNIPFDEFRDIANECDAKLVVDMAHISGIVAAGLCENPVEYADVVTSTTHKTLRGPRGGIILTNNQDISKKINSAVFPGLQGGPLMHIIAAKGICFSEALDPTFSEYMLQVLKNSKTMANTLISRGYTIISGGTDNHLFLVDLTNKDITGLEAETKLEKINITCNKNSIPNDKRSPRFTSGIRIGTPAITTRGFREEDSIQIANLIADCLEDKKSQDDLKNKVKLICDKNPLF